MKSKGLQLRLLYPARLSIKMKGEIRTFPDKRRLNEYTSSKQALKDVLKGLLQKVKKKSDRERNTDMKEVKWQ